MCVGMCYFVDVFLLLDDVWCMLCAQVVEPAETIFSSVDGCKVLTRTLLM